MPNPTIGEIVRAILSNDLLLDMLDRKRWYVDIDIVKTEKMSILKSPNKRLKVRQWDFPKVFMQQVQYDGVMMYLARATQMSDAFEHPQTYISGSWEDELRKLNQTYCW